MRQVISFFGNGKIELLDIPIRKPGKNEIRIKTNCSLISTGTERMLINFGKSNFIEKVKKQPEKVNNVVNKIKTDGIFPTVEAVNAKLNEPYSLGYSSVGIVESIGKNITNFSVGDRVVSNGPHADFVIVSKHLCAKIPNNVSDLDAAFTVLGSIALQGIRLASPTFQETFLVSGLGTIGLLTCQLLLANGCNVLGLDPDKKKCTLARKYGVKILDFKEKNEVLKDIYYSTNNLGVDGAIITAATSSSEPIFLAAEACRKRGRIILVGVTGLNLKRDIFYEKELTFQVSCSYGPGRYDSNYEDNCNDYPIGFVRWTENRNFEAILKSLSEKLINTSDLITKKYNIEDISEAYEEITSNNNNLGILLTYDNDLIIPEDKICLSQSNYNSKNLESKPIINLIGSGNYATRKLIPALLKNKLELNLISANRGVRPIFFGKKFGFNEVNVNPQELIADKKANTIIIASRHDSHSNFIIEALKEGKNIYVEKPLCINLNELKEIEKEYKKIIYKSNKLSSSPPILMIGFNRRFSKLISIIKNNLSTSKSPKSFIYTVNAGYVPINHWTQDSLIGGGRIIGECCHFVDLLLFLSGSLIKSLTINAFNESKSIQDTLTINIKFIDGSIGTVHYFSNGSKNFPKERLEIFSDGSIYQLDNFKKLIQYKNNKIKTKRLFIQDKGINSCIKEFSNAIVKNNKSPIKFEEIFNVHLMLLNAQTNIQKNLKY